VAWGRRCWLGEFLGCATARVQERVQPWEVEMTRAAAEPHQVDT
jgi:hypothetical protein